MLLIHPPWPYVLFFSSFGFRTPLSKCRGIDRCILLLQMLTLYLHLAGTVLSLPIFVCLRRGGASPVCLFALCCRDLLEPHKLVSAKQQVRRRFFSPPLCFVCASIHFLSALCITKIQVKCLSLRLGGSCIQPIVPIVIGFLSLKATQKEYASWQRP